jgi:SAM-dependent methyltransferase
VRKEMTIFEYGSGGSTLFWASKVKQVVSVEHDPGWFEKMNEELSHKQIKNVKFILVEAVNDLDPTSKRIENPEDYASADKQYENMNFREYVQTIDHFADHFFDFIVVDGRARPSCIAHALRKLKPGGYLIVDNSEREYYLASFHFDTSKWKRWDFEGPVPYIKHFSQTTVIQKKNI